MANVNKLNLNLYVIENYFHSRVLNSLRFCLLIFERVCRSSRLQMFFEVVVPQNLQYSQENICVGVSLS